MLRTKSGPPRDKGPLERGAICVSGVSRTYKVAHDRRTTLKEAVVRRGQSGATEYRALNKVDLVVQPSESVGIVGQNGCGKSTLLKLIAGILPPSEGTIETSGTIASMLELGAGFHPDFSGRENAYLNAAILGIHEREVDARIDDIIAFSEIGDVIDSPLRTYSSGMKMRLAFAVSSHVDADILLLDEVLAVGDEAFQRKCLGRIFEFQRGGGTLVFVSHDAGAVERVCSRAIVLDDGEVVIDAPAHEALNFYHRMLARKESRTTDAEHTQIDSEDEWGNGRLRLSNLRLMVDDRPTTSVLSGQSVTLAFEVEPVEPMDDPVFGIGIKTPDGLMCFGTNTSLDGVPTGRFEGVRTVEIEVPSLNLYEGRYVLHASGVSTNLQEVYHWLEDQWEFSVVPDRSGVGMVRMEFCWTIQSEARPSDAGTGELADEVLR